MKLVFKMQHSIYRVKMSGVISQGICFPLDILPQGDYKIEQDVTDIIGVKQYEQTMDNDKNVLNDFANKVRKYPNLLMRMK